MVQTNLMDPSTIIQTGQSLSNQSDRSLFLIAVVFIVVVFLAAVYYLVKQADASKKYIEETLRDIVNKNTIAMNNVSDGLVANTAAIRSHTETIETMNTELRTRWSMQGSRP